MSLIYLKIAATKNCEKRLQRHLLYPRASDLKQETQKVINCNVRSCKESKSPHLRTLKYHIVLEKLLYF